MKRLWDLGKEVYVFIDISTLNDDAKFVIEYTSFCVPFA